MAEANPHQLILEPAAQAFVEATNNPPYLFQIAPEDGRKAVDAVQDSEIFKPEIDEKWVDAGGVRTRIVRPKGATGMLPVILYVHGAGWVSATRTPTTGSYATSPSAPTPPSSSPNTTDHLRPVTPPPSNKAGPSRPGSSPRAPDTALTAAGWRSPATRSAAT